MLLVKFLLRSGWRDVQVRLPPIIRSTAIMIGDQQELAIIVVINERPLFQGVVEGLLGLEGQ